MLITREDLSSIDCEQDRGQGKKLRLGINGETLPITPNGVSIKNYIENKLFKFKNFVTLGKYVVGQVKDKLDNGFTNKHFSIYIRHTNGLRWLVRHIGTSDRIEFRGKVKGEAGTLPNDFVTLEQVKKLIKEELN